jgi:hypothetical protein
MVYRDTYPVRLLHVLETYVDGGVTENLSAIDQSSSFANEAGIHVRLCMTYLVGRTG